MSLPNPHDSLFKAFLSDKTVAKDFLDIYLPPAIKEKCDFSTLSIEAGSFIEEDLQSHFSDMLYSLKIAGHTGYIYPLIEHLSQSRPLTPFTVHRYSIAAMKQHIDRGHDKLPVVIPILFYRGTAPYAHSTNMMACFKDRGLATSVLGDLKPLILIDLSMIPDEELYTHRSLAMLELVQKHIKLRDVLELARYLVDPLLLAPLLPEQIKSVLYYLNEAGHCADPQRFIQFISHHSPPEYRKEMGTLADYFRQEGQPEVWNAALKKGKQEGKLEGKQEVAKKMLDLKFDLAAIKLATELEDEELAAIVCDLNKAI